MHQRPPASSHTGIKTPNASTVTIPPTNKIKKGSILTKRDGSLVFKYKRKCNEAPVGVVAASNRINRYSHLRVGMLIAHYYNYRCPDKGPTKFWSTYRVSGLDVRSSKSLTTMKETSSMWKLSMTRPIGFEYTNRSLGKGLKTRFFGGCNSTIGTVILKTDDKKSSLTN